MITHDCCICPSYGECGQPETYHCNDGCTACWPKDKENSFDCDSDSDCAPGMTCGNANCAWSSYMTMDDCCVMQAVEDCGCNGAGCWPHKNFDCDSDNDCSGNSRMEAIGAVTCGNGNCPWTSGPLATQDDCCIVNGCSGEAFEKPSETNEDAPALTGIQPVLADEEFYFVDIDRIALLGKPTDGFGDFIGVNQEDEITVTVSDGENSFSTPQRLFSECDQWTELKSGRFSRHDGMSLEVHVHEEDTSVHEDAKQVLDEGLLLGLPLGSTSRLRFYLDNEQNVFDSALLEAADSDLFEVCLSDVAAMALGPKGAMAVKLAKRAKLSVKAVKAITKTIKALKKADNKNKHYKKRYNKLKKKVETAQGRFLDAESKITGEEKKDPVTLPDWPTMNDAMEAFGVEPCVDFADGVIYKWTVYEVTLGFRTDSRNYGSEPKFLDGSKHSQGPEKCPREDRIRRPDNNDEPIGGAPTLPRTSSSILFALLLVGLGGRII